MRTIPKPADRDEWLEVRQPYFNASATAVLFDRHPFMSPGDYATVKLTREEGAETSAMRRGLAFEPAVAAWFQLEHDHELAEVDTLAVCGPMMATLDRRCQDGLPCEIKTTALYAREPERYWLDQCQAIMLCDGTDEMHLVWVDASMRLGATMVQEDTELQADILARAERFMAAVELGIVPDWVELSYSNVARLHPHPFGVAELDDAALDLVRELSTLRQIRRDAEKEEQLTKDALAKLLLDHEVGTWHGMEVLTWKASRPTFRLDVDMLTADHPDLVEKYSREIPGTRRMLTKLGEASL